MALRGGFTCQPGELLALVGPSGAGKTSMLRCIAGLLKPRQARISVGGQLWVDTEAGVCLSSQQRHVGLVFQNYALMPHMNAVDNVALSMLHLPLERRRERAAHWLDHVRLSREQQARKPAGLSGGQQQRVAVARALAREPRLLLLDEPFSAVDQMNRQGLYDLIADLRQELHIPIVLVTHDLVEARHLADSLVVMDAGTVLQQGTPAQIYRSPRNARVADLVGVQNRFQGQAVTWVVQGDALHIGDELTSNPRQVGPGQVHMQASVEAVRNLGETTLATLTVQALGGVALRVTRSGPQRQRLSVGQTLSLCLDCEWAHVMPSKTLA
jgi:molybdate transport system ATP-binding protein